MAAENRGLSRLILLIAVSLLLPGCLEKGEKQSSPQLVQGNIGGHNVYIPKSYINMRYTSVGSESVLIQAWYPGDKVVPGDPDALWRKKQWYKNVRILASWYPHPASMTRILDTQLTLTRATQVVGVEYDLVHQTQPTGIISDRDDLWIDNNSGQPTVIIGCSHLENTAHIPHVPQCKEQILSGNYHIQVGYDRRLLPRWRRVHDHVLSLLNSFNSPQSASAYFKTVTEQPLQQEENP